MAINTNEIKWASQDVNDPLSGAPNKVAPTAEFQNDGLKRNEAPPRAYLNYQFDKYHEFFADLQAQIDALAVSAGAALLEQIFHVGAVYISASSQSPASRFGFGTWERIKGKMIVGVDENDTDYNAAGKTGGSKTHSHSNNLSINSAGSHTHEVSHDNWGNTQSASGHLPEPSVSGRLVTGSGKSEQEENLESLAHANGSQSTSTSGAHTHTMSGGINSSSNVSPYISEYMWVRVA